jgi:hypothetical protein
MKKIIFLISILACLYNIGFAQNIILAGQTSGNNIYYTDLEPDSSLIAYNPPERFFIDINMDGIVDLGFCGCFEGIFSMFKKIYTSVEILNNKVTILSTGTLAKKLELGDTISANQDWSTNSTILDLAVHYISYYPLPGYDTIYGFRNSGYLGFKIEEQNETFYGWMNISTSPSSVQVKEIGICGLTVGVVMAENNRSLQLFPNPCRNEVEFDFDFLDANDFSYQVIDILGRVIIANDILNKKTKINTSELTPGIYTLRIVDGEKQLRTEKFIKQRQ